MRTSNTQLFTTPLFTNTKPLTTAFQGKYIIEVKNNHYLQVSDLFPYFLEIFFSLDQLVIIRLPVNREVLIFARTKISFLHNWEGKVLASVKSVKTANPTRHSQWRLLVISKYLMEQWGTLVVWFLHEKERKRTLLENKRKKKKGKWEMSAQISDIQLSSNGSL